MGYRKTLVLVIVFVSAGALAADPEKDAYKACFDTIDVKLTAKQAGGKIEDVRKAYIAELKDRTDGIIGWYPDMSFSKSKVLKEAFEKKGRSSELFDKFAEEYGKAMPYLMKRVNENLKAYETKLLAPACDDPGHIEVTKALEEARTIVADALMLNKRIEKKIKSAVEDELSFAIDKYFKWDKPGTKSTRAERLDAFITGFISVKVVALREIERKNGEGLIPHRAVPPARPDTHR